MKRIRRPKPKRGQLALPIKGRGGAGRGQGRKKRKHGYVPHRARPFLEARFPVHISMSIARGLPSLRGRRLWELVRRGFVYGCKTALGFRIVHYAVNGQHIHLICEAKNRTALSRGIQGFKSRLGQTINNRLGRKGAVFTDRYHERILTNPTQCRHALAYVLNNQRHHAYAENASYPAGCVDPHSSAMDSCGWNRRVTTWSQAPPTAWDDRPTVAAPTSWLLRCGWRRGGAPLSPDRIPGLPKGAPQLPVW
jgi:hypothetical protein